MKTLKLFLFATVFAFCGTVGVAQSLCDYVNPMIGTGGHAHTFPGPAYPNGMIQPSPDTRIDQWDACSGYYYGDTTINGFSHTHCSGTGCCDYGDVLIMPTVGKQEIQYNGGGDVLSFASAFSHNREYAEPGYYRVFLERYGIQAEMTCSQRAAIHRWTFPKSSDAGVIIDLDYSLQRQYNSKMQVQIVEGKNAIVGFKQTSYWAPNQQICFYAEFNKPFTAEIITDSTCVSTPRTDAKDKSACKVLLHFATQDGEQVMCKVGISAVGVVAAAQNATNDVPAWDFDAVRNATRNAWEEYLGKIEIDVPETDLGKETRQIFYTALYHTGIQPYLYTDYNGRHRGMDGRAHNVDTPMYTVYSLWDTFRAYHPLMTIIQPERNQEFIRSLLQKADEGGVLPMWELSANYTATMIGYHAVPVIVDAYMKGQRNFDAEKALAACVRAAEGTEEGIKATPAFCKALMPASKHYQHTIGYAPFDNENETVAKGLEYAYDDWCISVMAREMGKTDIANRFAKYGQNYKNYFDRSTGFMRGKNLAGEWRTPFNPYTSEHRNDDYCEGTAWQWTWFAPHDVQGLVKLMGGKKAFTTKLDSLFTVSSNVVGSTTSADISGMIGQYAHGNEPSHATIHYYNYIEQPWKVQQLCDQVLFDLYNANVDGLSGNEDCGQMSAWYILNAMGFYQVAPGKPVYSIGRPIFNEVTINLPEGRKFKVVCHNQSRDNKYIAKMMLNGKPLKTPFFTHEQLAAGGTLELWMTATPVKK